MVMQYDVYIHYTKLPSQKITPFQMAIKISFYFLNILTAAQNLYSVKLVLTWNNSNTFILGKRLGGYLCNAWCTSLAYDSDAKYAFVGKL